MREVEREIKRQEGKHRKTQRKPLERRKAHTKGIIISDH